MFLIQYILQMSRAVAALLSAGGEGGELSNATLTVGAPAGLLFRPAEKYKHATCLDQNSFATETWGK